MSDFSMFMKENKIPKSNKFYPATSSLLNEDGTPLLWELKAVTTAESEEIQNECLTYNDNKYGFNYPLFINKLICACVVKPNLNDKELQDSYGCLSPEDLIKEMINSPGEYSALADFVQEMCGFGENLESKIKRAKN